MYKNLRISAYLQSGVVSDRNLPIDAILFHHAVRKKLGVEVATKSRETVSDVSDVRLPIEVENAGRPDWFYRASFAIWPDNTIEQSTFKVKQGDWLRYPEYVGKSGKIDIQRGNFRNYHIKMYYRHAERVCWFVRGDIDEIAGLLQFCTHIGKNSSDGWGAVLRWTVEVVCEDYSVYKPDGSLNRAIPADSGVLYGLRPSYWMPENVFKCCLPG